MIYIQRNTFWQRYPLLPSKRHAICRAAKNWNFFSELPKAWYVARCFLSSWTLKYPWKFKTEDEKYVFHKLEPNPVWTKSKQELQSHQWPWVTHQNNYSFLKRNYLSQAYSKQDYEEFELRFCRFHIQVFGRRGSLSEWYLLHSLSIISGVGFND